jgi:hypothetical protein
LRQRSYAPKGQPVDLIIEECALVKFLGGRIEKLRVEEQA